MEDYGNSISENSRINLSRNTPVALVVGVGSFLGSYVAEELVSRGIQVIGTDDMSGKNKDQLSNLVKEKTFHLLQSSFDDSRETGNLLVNLALPRLDYAFFMAEKSDGADKLEKELVEFLYFVEKSSGEEFKESLKKKAEKKRVHKTKTVLVSDILLYNNELTVREKNLKQAEILFARFSKENGLNSRVVRVGTVYGPRMDFGVADPLVKIIQQAIVEKLEESSIGMEFVTQGIYAKDAAEMVVKSVLAGATANKIYDCLRPHPVYIAELKQLLVDPLWFEEKGFKPTLLPEWLSPNLGRGMKELNWHPKTTFQEGLQETIKYFKSDQQVLEELEKSSSANDESSLKRWSFSNPLFDEPKIESKMEEFKDEKYEDLEEAEFIPNKKRGVGGWAKGLLITGLIIAGLVLPVFQLVYGGLMIKNNLRLSSEELEKGEFEKAFKHLDEASAGVKEARSLFSALALAQRLGIFDKQISGMQQMVDLVDEGVDGINHSLEGTKALYQSTKYISGEENGDVGEQYAKAQLELDQAQKKLEIVSTRLGREDLLANVPDFFDDRVEDLRLRIAQYSELVEKAKAAAYILPNVTAIDGKKSYLVLLQNNLELRAGGGFIGSYAKISFEKGKVVDVKVDDIYTIDGQLKDVIEPPAELKSDLGQTRWYLRDSNSEADFPTSAKQAELFYRRETGEVVSGVVAMNLSASARLVDAVGGVDLPEYGESVNGSNLFEKTVTRAEGGFFPGSQAKKNYLTALQSQLFNKIFYLSKNNWPAIISAVGKSLEDKQMMVYFGDPQLFSYVLSENWGGVLPRGTVGVEGTNKDFISIVEANYGANKANYYLERKVNLETIFGKEGEINHKLMINYKNKSGANVFPGGRYKYRLKVYLPAGARLNKLLFGESDITKQAVSFTDYGRSGYSVLLELNPEEQKNLVMEYNLIEKLSFKDNKNVYRMDVVKQSGWMDDQFDWQLSYPLNMYVQEGDKGSKKSEQKLEFSSDLSTDRAFQLTLLKR